MSSASVLRERGLTIAHTAGRQLTVVKGISCINRPFLCCQISVKCMLWCILIKSVIRTFPSCSQCLLPPPHTTPPISLPPLSTSIPPNLSHPSLFVLFCDPLSFTRGICMTMFPELLILGGLSCGYTTKDHDFSSPNS